jgi:hypothetical protein
MGEIPLWGVALSTATCAFTPAEREFFIDNLLVQIRHII